jgi:hypothetical protein
MYTPKSYYWARGPRVYGPVTSGELRRLAAAGRLLRTDRVRTAAWGRWVAAREVKGLFPAVTPSGRPPCHSAGPTRPQEAACFVALRRKPKGARHVPADGPRLSPWLAAGVAIVAGLLAYGALLSLTEGGRRVTERLAAGLREPPATADR